MPRLLSLLGLPLLLCASASAFLVSPPLAITRSSARSASTILSMSGGQGAVLRVKEVPEKKEWVPLLKASEIAPGDKIPVTVDGLALMVVADEDGSVYCTASCSPFMSAPLTDGSLRDGCIVCPQSGSAFDLATGELVGPWCPFPPVLAGQIVSTSSHYPGLAGPLVMAKLYPARNLATFPVRARGNDIEAFLDRNIKARFESKYWAGLLDAQGKATGDYY